VEEMALTQPSEIQSQAYNSSLQGRESLTGSTGTGKTAAFAIPIIDLVDPEFESAHKHHSLPYS